MIDANTKTDILQRFSFIQHELFGYYQESHLVLTPKLEKLVHTLDWLDFDKLLGSSWCGIGRKPYQRYDIAKAFIAKSVLRISQTSALLDRLMVDSSLRRICGFVGKIPSASTFSRAFAEFARMDLPRRVHDVLIKKHVGNIIVGHLSRDGTAIEAREKPVKQKKIQKLKNKRGRPKKGEVREKPLTAIQAQRKKPLAQMMADIPKSCNTGTKMNAKGYKTTWNGYKLHIDTNDFGVVISCLLSSASMHDSLAAIPLSLMSNDKVTSLYEVMDAGYCSEDIRQHCRELGHVPIIDHNPRGGKKIEFDKATKLRYNIRTIAEKTNARLKDEFTANDIWVKGHQKVDCHLMFAVLALSVDQLMRVLI